MEGNAVLTNTIGASVAAAQAARQQALTGSLQGTGGGTLDDATKAKMKDKAQQFESFFIYQFIELMRPEPGKTEFSGGAGEEMFRHHLNEQLADSMAKSGGFGIADTVYGELVRQQEAANGNAAVNTQQNQSQYTSLARSVQNQSQE